MSCQGLGAGSGRRVSRVNKNSVRFIFVEMNPGYEGGAQPPIEIASVLPPPHSSLPSSGHYWHREEEVSRVTSNIFPAQPASPVRLSALPLPFVSCTSQCLLVSQSHFLAQLCLCHAVMCQTRKLHVLGLSKNCIVCSVESRKYHLIRLLT